MLDCCFWLVFVAGLLACFWLIDAVGLVVVGCFVLIVFGFAFGDSVGYFV